MKQQQWRKLHYSLWSSSQVMKLPLQARILYLYMVSAGDDHGRFKADGSLLRVAFPYDDFSAAEVSGWRDTIERVGLIKIYEKYGEICAFHPNWREYQGGKGTPIRPDRKESELPLPEPNITPNTKDKPTVSQSSANTLPKFCQSSAKGMATVCQGSAKTERKNRKKEEKEEKESAADAAGTSKKKKYGDTTPMSLKEFGEWMDKSSQRHMEIVSWYADQKKPNYTTRGQWEAFIARNTRAARDLSPYTDDQIVVAYKKLKEAERDYLTKWSLETLIRYLD